MHAGYIHVYMYMYISEVGKGVLFRSVSSVQGSGIRTVSLYPTLRLEAQTPILISASCLRYPEPDFGNRTPP